KKAEEKGFEPLVPYGTTVFKTVAINSQGPLKQRLTDTQSEDLQTSLQKNSENDQNRDDVLPDDLADIVALWPELPEHIKAAIKALVGSYEKGGEQ
ncbi:MAG: hypothetical protein JW902_09710, partial [Syntrophaceae bacterium]|nr:hypothetical protein [Syntrophaceae bacterium]